MQRTQHQSGLQIEQNPPKHAIHSLVPAPPHRREGAGTRYTFPTMGRGWDQTMLSSVKYKVPAEKQSGVVYKISCSCGKVYLGDSTRRRLETRLKENKDACRRGELQKSANVEHACGCTITPANGKRRQWSTGPAHRTATEAWKPSGQLTSVGEVWSSPGAGWQNHSVVSYPDLTTPPGERRNFLGFSGSWSGMSDRQSDSS